MTLTPVYMAIPAYLLVGCILMLLANELAYGAVTRTDFVRGMLLWPLGVVLFLESFLSSVWARYFGKS